MNEYGDEILQHWLNIHTVSLFHDVCRYSENHILILDKHPTVSDHVMVDMWSEFKCFEKAIFKYIDQETSNSSIYLLNIYGGNLLCIIKDALDRYVERYKNNNVDYLVWKRRENYNESQ